MSKNINNDILNPPAFPESTVTKVGDIVQQVVEKGMTLRDYFAADSLTAAHKIAVRENDYFEEQPQKKGRATPEDVAKIAYEIAAAMLKERSNG